MSTLAAALDTYCHAIACGAGEDTLNRAFAALGKAHRDHQYATGKAAHDARMADYQEQRTT